MERRATMARSPSSALPKMNARVALLLCSVIGSTVAYPPNIRQVPYNTGPNDFSVEVTPSWDVTEQSQRLFWSNGQGSNQVGGTGLWAMLTNKFPFLNSFGRLEVGPEYGAPAVTYGVPQVSTNYGVPTRFQPQYTQTPQAFAPRLYRAPQFYQPQQYVQQQYPTPQQAVPFVRFAPGSRDVGFTDDAVIVTPPQVPVNPPRPVVPAPPAPPPPQPTPPAIDGYSYNKPQYKLELPQK